MEETTKDAKEEPIVQNQSLCELLKLGYIEKEAQELQEAKISFPHVKQEMWPIVRLDKVPRQQYHLMQVPFDVEIDEEIGFILVYNILFHFEKPATCYIREDIIALTRERLDVTKIEVGDILQPIAPLYSTRGNRAWNGMIKAHLKNPTTNGVTLLEGRQIFMLMLDGVPTIAKVAKGFNNTAPENQLSANITSDSMAYLEAHSILSNIVKDSFRRKIEYEIMQVQKSPRDNHAFLIATLSEQHMKMIKSQIAIDGEMLTPTATRPAKLLDKEKAKRNCLVLIMRNINRAKPVVEVETAIKRLFGTKNVANIFFSNQEEQLHSGTTNVEVTTPATYNQYVTKNIKMLNHYVKFIPHPHSLDGLVAPNKTQLKEFGFTISTRPWLI